MKYKGAYWDRELLYLYHPSFQLIILLAYFSTEGVCPNQWAFQATRIILRIENKIAALYFIHVGQPALLHQFPIKDRMLLEIRVLQKFQPPKPSCLLAKQECL